MWSLFFHVSFCVKWLIQYVQLPLDFSVDVKSLRKKALERPFPVDHVIVVVDALEPSCTVAVSNFPPMFSDEVIAMYFETLAGKSPQVTRKGEEKVVVTFETHEGKVPVLYHRCYMYQEVW